MMHFDVNTVNSAAAAFVAGLVVSPHCIGMCGPLGCSFLGMGQADNVQVSTAVYHLVRILAYALTGAIAGIFGSSFLGFFEAVPTQLFPWALVAVFLVLAFRLERYIPKPKFLQTVYHRLTAKLRKTPQPLTGVILGAATPFLPCAPLYAIFGLALFSGSGWHGAELAFGFGLGTLPLLWFAQSQYFRFRNRFSALWLQRTQRSLALLAAVIVAWRLAGSHASDAFAYCITPFQ